MSDTNASVKALRELARDRGLPLEEIYKHFRTATRLPMDDRLMVITCAAAVEESLRVLLEDNMPNGAGKLFDINQPLCTFSAKIAVAYSFDLINGDVRRNADYIREIRNAFAHRIAPIDFKTEEVANVCKLLQVYSRVSKELPEVDTDMKPRYFWAALTTISAITNAGADEEHPAPLR